MIEIGGQRPVGGARVSEYDKLELLQKAGRGGSISKACQRAEISRDTYYRARRLYASGGRKALRPASRQTPNLKNRTPRHSEEAVLVVTREEPKWGKARV